MPATFCFALQSKYLNKFKLSLCTILNIIKVCIVARNTKNIYENFHFHLYFYLKKHPQQGSQYSADYSALCRGQWDKLNKRAILTYQQRENAYLMIAIFAFLSVFFHFEITAGYGTHTHKDVHLWHTLLAAQYTAQFSGCSCCYCNISIWTTKVINIKYLLDTSSSENSWGPLDVCVMYVNIFQVFCLFSITSGGNDWLCAILLPLWACECLLLYLARLCLSVSVCVCMCKWLGLISHNKSNWLLIGYIWKKWNAQSLLISHFSHLLKQETSNARQQRKRTRSRWRAAEQECEEWGGVGQRGRNCPRTVGPHFIITYFACKCN